MSLLVNLSIKEQKLLYQQDTECTVILKNAGKTPITVAVPPMDQSQPTLSILNLQSGSEKQFASKPGGRPGRHPPVTLAPGISKTAGFILLDKVPDLVPGEYEVRALWAWNDGAEQAESNAVRVTVSPTTPRALVLADAGAGDGSMKYGVWVNMAPEGDKQLVRSGFSLIPGPRVREVLPVAKCHPLTRAAISAPGTTSRMPSQWVGWLDDDAFRYAHVDPDNGVTKVQEVKLPTGEVRLVNPLFSSPRTSAEIRPAGAALLCFSLPGATQFRLQTMELSVDKPKPLGAGGAKGKIPDWITGHVRRKDEWIATWIHKLGLHVILSRGSWPGLKAQDVGEVKLADWAGGYVAAGATMGPDLEVYGGVLMWEPPAADDPQGVQKLVMQPWQLTPQNDFIEGERLPVDWHPNTPIVRAKVSVSNAGVAAALLQDDEDKWHIFDGDAAVVPAPTAFEKTELPLEIAFLHGDGDPILIGAKLQRGYMITDLGGAPIPPPPK